MFLEQQKIEGAINMKMYGPQNQFDVQILLNFW